MFTPGYGEKKRKPFEAVVQNLQKVEQYLIFLGFFVLVMIYIRLAILSQTKGQSSPVA